MNICYICKVELDELNQSEEHILHNSIGGRLKSSELICRTCNSNFGNKSDTELAKQLNFFSNILMIKRDRGEPQPIILENTITGEKFKVDSKGQIHLKNPTITQEKDGNQTRINIKARNIKEAENILNGLKKKYPKIDVDDLLKQAIITEEHILEPLHSQLTVGGKELFPAILKIALNYYIYRTKNINAVSNAIELLKTNNSIIVEPIILEKRTYEILDTEACHSIFINGNKKERKLYAIIELFNIYQFIVKLNDNYDYEDISLLYVYDTISNSEVRKEIEHIHSTEFVFNFNYANSNPQFQILQKNALRTMKIAYQKQLDEKISEITTNALKKTIEKLIPPGEPITMEAIQLFTSEVALQFTRFLSAMQTRKRWHST